MIFKEGFTSEDQFAFPSILNVCVFKGVCTAKCVHCPLGQTEISERKQKFGDGCMDVGLFKKLADEVVEYPQSVLRIHSVGEPTLWTDLSEAVDYAHAKGVLTWIFTNAITVKKHLLENLVEKCNIVEVSINSFDSTDYLRTKGVDAYEVVADNIRHMSEHIAKKNLKTRLLISRVESDNKVYDSGFLDFWKGGKMAADVFIRSYHSYNSIIENKLQRKKVVACNVHWSRFNIDITGDVVICYNELFRGPALDRSLILGNVRTQSIREIWHGEKLSKIRESQYCDKPELIDFTENMPCADCHYCQPLNSNNPKSEVQIRELQRAGC